MVSSNYDGIWYEIGKIQTPGGAFFEKECVCTQLNIYNTTTAGDALASNVCRYKTPSGKIVIANGTLTANKTAGPGHYRESFPGSPTSVAYNVIYLDHTASVEYDCVEELGLTNYCFHVLSRAPTLAQSTQDMLMKLVDQFDLNPAKIAYKATVQQGCWSEGL